MTEVGSGSKVLNSVMIHGTMSKAISLYCEIANCTFPILTPHNKAQYMTILTGLVDDQVHCQCEWVNIIALLTHTSIMTIWNQPPETV